MRGLVPKFIMPIICLLHINYRPFDPCERVLTPLPSRQVNMATVVNEFFVYLEDITANPGYLKG